MKQTADVILEKRKTYIIGGKEYEVAPPSLGLIIEASGLIPDGLTIDDSREPEKAIGEMLKKGKYMAWIGDLAALLILGEGEHKEEVVEKKFFGLITRKKIVDRRAELARECRKMKPMELFKMVAQGLFHQDVDGFFVLTTFLLGANLVAPTREVGTTASGQ